MFLRNDDRMDLRLRIRVMKSQDKIIFPNPVNLDLLRKHIFTVPVSSHHWDSTFNWLPPNQMVSG